MTFVNPALGASHPSEQYLLFRLATKNASRPRALVIGFYDFQLTLEEHTTVAELFGNRALAFDSAIRVTDAFHIYQFSFPDQVKFLSFRAFPTLATGAMLEYVEKLRRKLAAIGMPSAGESNEFGRVADFNALESTSVEDFDRDAWHSPTTPPLQLSKSADDRPGQGKWYPGPTPAHA